MRRVLTRRNFLKAGIIGAAVLAGAGGYTYCSRQDDKTNSELVKKLELPAGFEHFGRLDLLPKGLAGQNEGLVSFLLREEGEKPLMKKKLPDKLGLYVMDNSGARRIGDFPVSPYALIPQGDSAICNGNQRYDCLNLQGPTTVEVRRTNLNNANLENALLSNLVYRQKGSEVRIESAVEGKVLLRDEEKQKFLFFDSSKPIVLGYDDAVKLRFPEGNEWKSFGDYMKRNSPPGFEQAVDDYIRREDIRARVGSGLNKAGEGYKQVIIWPNGISGNTIFGIVYGKESYEIVRKQLEKEGGKK